MAKIFINIVYKGTGSSYTTSSSSIAITSPLAGSSFSFTSADPTDPQFIATGNNVAGTLSYVDASGNVISMVGEISRQDKAGSNTKAYYFVENGTGLAFLIVEPADQGAYSGNQTVNTDSSPFLTKLNAFLATQASEPVISIADVSASESATHIEFVVSLSNAASANISFTPSLTSGTATVGTDTGTGLEYYNGSSWVAVSGAVTIAQGATSLRIRAAIVDDALAENSENFQLLTGAISGGNVTNSSGTFGSATITDNDTPAPAETVTVTAVTDDVSPATGVVASGGATNDTAPEIGGSLSSALLANEVLEVFRGGVKLGNATITGGGTTWTYADSGLSHGTSYTYTAKVTNTVTNLSGTVSGNYVISIDTAAPTVPTVTALTTNDTTPSIQGTANLGSGEALTVTVDGRSYAVGDGNLSVSGNNWTLTIPSANQLSAGTYAVTATITDSAGNVSNDATSNEVVIDLTAPTTPTVTALTTNDSTPSIQGTANLGSGEVLTVTVDGRSYAVGDGNLSVSGNNWTLTIPSANQLSAGTYAVTATITDSAGNVSNDATSNEIVIDLTAPTTPTVTALTTNDSTPSIQGTANLGSGEVLTVTVDGRSYAVGDGNLSVSGNNWTLTIPSANQLSAGTYAVTATITDSAGNVSNDVTSNEIVIDLTAPTTPTVTALTTNDSTPSIQGTANLGSGEVLTVTVDGRSYAVGDGNLSVSGNNWTLTIPSANQLSAGTYAVTATITDSAGNVSNDATSNEIVIDLTAPTTPTVTALTTNDSTPSIQGTANLGSGEVLTVTVDGRSYAVGDGNLSVSGNNWTLTIPSANQLSAGTYAVTATITDSAGNVSGDVTSNEIVIDLIAPTTPTVTALTTNDTTPSIQGTASLGSGEVLTVTVDGRSYAVGDGNLSVSGNNWTLTIPSANQLSAGTYAVTATITDSAGNVSNDATSNEIVIDLTAPTTPTVTALTTNDSTPSIQGTANLGSGEVLTVTVDGRSYAVGDGNLSVSGNNWTLTIPSANQLSAGTYAVTATITDSAGNVSNDATSNEIVIDLTAPTTPTVTALTTNDTTPSIQGTASLASGEVLSVTVDGRSYAVGDGNLSVSGNNWTLTIPSANQLSAGTYAVTATITDSAGNVSSDATSNEIVIDLTAPATPTVTALTTNDSTPSIQGTANLGSGEVLTVSVDGRSYAVGDGNLSVSGNNWTLTIPSANQLSAGTYAVTATITDSAGNVSNDATSNEVAIDLTAPTTPTVTALTTNDSTPSIQGTASLGSGEVLTVTVDGRSYAVGDGNLSVSGNNWILTIPSANQLSAGTYAVTATITDSAGNVSNDATSNEVVIDLTAPTTPTVTALTTNDTTPSIQGTANLGSGEVLSVTVDGRSYAVGDGNLSVSGNNWTLTIPSANQLSAGTYAVTATITDSASNVSNDATSNEIVIDLIAPTTPTVTALTTNDSTPSIQGTANLGSGEVLTVTVDGRSYAVGDGNLSVSGNNWTLTIPSANQLSAGTYAVTATITDSAGNVSGDVTSNEIVIDLTAPTTPTVTALTTNDATPSIQGTASLGSGEVLTVSIDGRGYAVGDGNLNVSGNNWTLTIPSANQLSAGTYAVTATITDSAGNVSNDATSNEVVIDLTAPTTPTITALTTNDTTPSIQGTASLGSGEVLTVTVDGRSYAVGDGNLSVSGNNWTLTIPSANQLRAGSYSVLASISDAAGNVQSDVSANELTIDTLAPDVRILGISDDTGQDGDFVTSDQNLSFFGTAEADSVIDLQLNGQTIATVQCNSSGNWSVDYTGVKLGWGSYTLTANAKDKAGNLATAHQTFSVLSAYVNQSSDTGTQTADQIPVANKPEVTIAAGNILGDGDTARLIDSKGQLVASVAVTPDAVKNGQVSIPTLPIDDGIYTFSAQIISLDGTLKGQIPLTVQVVTDLDGIAPSVENAAHGGDFNRDGVPDWMQNNLAQLPLRSLADFALGKNAPESAFGAIMIGNLDPADLANAVQLDSSAQLFDVGVVVNDHPLPSNTVALTPLLEFSVKATTNQSLLDLDPLYPGLQTRVVIELPTPVVANDYQKWNPVSAQWESFLDDQNLATYDSGATLIDSDQDGKIDRVVLTYTDGGDGDEDGVANGVIVDPGLLVLRSNPVYSILLANGDRYYTMNASEAALMAKGEQNIFEGVRFDSLDASASTVAINAYRQPFTGDWHFAGATQSLPFACYFKDANASGFFAAAADTKIGVDIHLYVNARGITQLLSSRDAEQLGLAAQGYADRGVQFKTTTDSAFSFSVEGFLAANKDQPEVQKLVSDLATMYQHTTDAGFIEAVEQYYLTHVTVVGLLHGDAASLLEMNTLLGTYF